MGNVGLGVRNGNDDILKPVLRYHSKLNSKNSPIKAPNFFLISYNKTFSFAQQHGLMGNPLQNPAPFSGRKKRRGFRGSKFESRRRQQKKYNHACKGRPYLHPFTATATLITIIVGGPGATATTRRLNMKRYRKSIFPGGVLE